MYEISFIVPCYESEDCLMKTIDLIISFLEYSDQIEIVIINRKFSDKLYSAIMDRECQRPNNILLINIEDALPEATYENIGLNYSESLCYMYLSNPIENITFEFFDGLKPIKGMCNEDQYKYIKDKYTYILMCFNNDIFRFEQVNELPMLTDYRENAGQIDAHYFFQDIYVASLIRKKKIDHVYDIGSRVDGYISHLLAMDVHITMVDIRPLPFEIENLDFIEGDATDLSGIETGSIPVLSCLHALEHFGLGRYGDPIDHSGWLKALFSFKRVISAGGYLYLSVPVGKYETVMFNAHRIFNPITIISNMIPTFKIMEFTLFHEGKRTTFDFSRESSYKLICSVIQDISSSVMGEYDCGIFVFQKI